MTNPLQLVITLLFAAVIVVVLFRQLKLPSILGYLLVGVAIGPHSIGLVTESEGTEYLAEFGVVFLMFSIGLEFSLAKFMTMRRLVFGLGGAQVVLTILALVVLCWVVKVNWRDGIVLGGVMAMSSTAIVSKLLSERLELNTEHGRQVLSVLLFQDLAVVPLLVLIPALHAGSAGALFGNMGIALIKAAAILTLLLFFGQKFMREWFHIVARQKSSELFVLNVLFITLSLAYITQLAGLSMALGAFVAGMLISETEYRYQVENDIQPFRDILLGLFFVTVGMMLNFKVVVTHFGWVVLAVFGFTVGKTVLIAGVSKLFGTETNTALRTGMNLAQAGEFGFVLLSLAADSGVLSQRILQPVLAASVISMVLAPFIIARSERIARHFRGAEWMERSMRIMSIAAQSTDVDQHVLICGYGRSGQNLARLLARENISFIAIDNDPRRVREASAAGQSVVFGDATRHEVLVAAGLLRAKVLVVSVADTRLALGVLEQVREARPEMPVIVRTFDDTDIDKLREAGASEVVAEIMEGSLMLASHALMLLGVPLNRVLKRIRTSREQRYGLFRGFFRGATDTTDMLEESAQPRLHTIVIEPGTAAIGQTLAQIDLDGQGVELQSMRRHNHDLAFTQETTIKEADVLVLLGTEQSLAAAEMWLLQGKKKKIKGEKGEDKS